MPKPTATVLYTMNRHHGLLAGFTRVNATRLPMQCCEIQSACDVPSRGAVTPSLTSMVHSSL